MKHIFLLILSTFIFLSACQFDEKSYTFVREYNSGTYQTSQGASKYISGLPDTATIIRDVYAKVEETVTYTANAKDSILIYGHVWGTSPKAKVTEASATMYMIDNDEDGKPDQFMDTLSRDDTFESIMINLVPETPYYVRSYVITGDFNNGQAVPKDTAFNPVETQIITAAPKDVWEERMPFDGNQGDGAISFTYKDEIYVGLVNNQYGIFKEIYKYNPNSDSWTQATTYPGTSISNAVAFVITNVRVNVGVYKDYAYIGTGFTVDGTDTLVTNEFYRWNLTDDSWLRLKDNSQFPGFGRQEAIAFTLNGKGYVGLGTGTQNGILDDVYQLDPTLTDSNHPQGTWRQMTRFRAGPRTKAAGFKIGNTYFVCGGMDDENTLRNDLWMYRQTIDGKGAWIQKKSFPSTPRADAVGFTIEDFGYIGTGQDADSICSDFWRYNPFIDDWEQRAFYGGGARKNAIGEGIKYGDNDFRGYLGLGRGETITDYFQDIWQYRP